MENIYHDDVSFLRFNRSAGPIGTDRQIESVDVKAARKLEFFQQKLIFLSIISQKSFCSSISF